MTMLDSITFPRSRDSGPRAIADERTTKTVARARQKARQTADEDCDESSCDEEWIKALLLDAQAKLVKKGKASSILFIFDDGLGSINYQSQIFQKLATTSRHYKIS
jgi:hypothetical protein